MPTSRGAVRWTTTVLAAISLLAAVDRQSFAELLVPIQKDLHVNDAAMGALTGSAYALVYALVAFPLAQIADRANRRNMISIAVGVWSVATIVCGFASSYALLMLARLGVGASESGYLPATMSMVGDLAPEDRRGVPISMLTLGAMLGISGGGLLGGVLNDHFGWHVAMMAIGLPGLAVAATMLLTVREPVRGSQDQPASVAPDGKGLRDALRRSRRIPGFYPFATAFFFLNVSFVGWLTWMPAFLMRVHHLTTTQMGALFGAIIFSSIVANLVSGPLSDRLARRGPRLRIYYCVVVAALAVPLLVASTLVASLAATVGLLLAYCMLTGGLTSVSQAVYVSMAPADIRAVMTAMMNVIALGLAGGVAPALFGAVNDVLKQTYGDQSLRYTLLLTPLTMGLAAIMYLVASRRTPDPAGRPVAESIALLLSLD